MLNVNVRGRKKFSKISYVSRSYLSKYLLVPRPFEREELSKRPTASAEWQRNRYSCLASVVHRERRQMMKRETRPRTIHSLVTLDSKCVCKKRLFNTWMNLRSREFCTRFETRCPKDIFFLSIFLPSTDEKIARFSTSNSHSFVKI